MREFEDLFKLLPKRKLLQIAPNGPNVNWSFAKKLESSLKVDSGAPIPIDIGSYGLYTTHLVFKNCFRKTSFNVPKLLVSFYYLFHDSPARRQDFTEVTGSTALCISLSLDGLRIELPPRGFYWFFRTLPHM